MHGPMHHSSPFKQVRHGTEARRIEADALFIDGHVKRVVLPTVMANIVVANKIAAQRAQERSDHRVPGCGDRFQDTLRENPGLEPSEGLSEHHLRDCGPYVYCIDVAGLAMADRGFGRNAVFAAFCNAVGASRGQRYGD
jgi:hypothetical protein